MVRFTLLTIFDKCNFGGYTLGCDFSFLLTSRPPLISFSRTWWHLPFFPAVKFAEADKMSVLERSGLCHSEATNIGHLEKSYLAGGDREYLSTEKKPAKILFMLLNECLDSTLSIWDTGQDTQIWLIRDTKNILFLFEWWQIYCVTSSSPLAGFLPFLTPCFGFEAFKLSSRCLCCCSSSTAVLLLSFVTLMH